MRQPTSRLSRALVLATAWMALGGAICAAPAGETGEPAAIRELIGKTWDTPEAKVVVDPVAIDGEHAIASWTQGARGGRALLRKRDAAWAVVLCSGDPLKEASALVEAGVPEASAKKLAADLAAAESKTDPARVKLFSTFEGVMRVDDEGHHGHHDQKHHDHD